MNNNEITISISDVFKVLLKRWWIILLVAAVVFASVYAVASATYSEEYTSKSTIMVRNPEENLSASSSAYYYDLTKTAVNDCQILMTSRTALYYVIDELNLDEIGITYSKLLSMIEINGYTDSHVLEVSVTSDNPDLSKEIVDTLCAVGAKQIQSHIDFATARVIDEGTVNRHPSNSVNIQMAIIIALIAAVLVLGIFVIISIADDKIRTSEDIEKRLGLSVLGVIPFTENENATKKNKAEATK